MLIHILDVPRCRPKRVQGSVVVGVPADFDRKLAVAVLDRLGIEYDIQRLSPALSWYRVPENTATEPVWRVNFLTPGWQITQPWLYHAGFDAGYAGSWLDQGWRRPDRIISSHGRITLTDTPVFDPVLWAGLLRGEPIEPVDLRVRAEMREQGFALLIDPDPPEDAQERAVWLLSAEPKLDKELLQSRRDLSRQLFQPKLQDFFAFTVPVWAGRMHCLRQEIAAAARAEGFWVPKV